MITRVAIKKGDRLYIGAEKERHGDLYVHFPQIISEEGRPIQGFITDKGKFFKLLFPVNDGVGILVFFQSIFRLFCLASSREISSLLCCIVLFLERIAIYSVSTLFMNWFDFVPVRELITPAAKDAFFTCTTGPLYTGSIFTAV